MGGTRQRAPVRRIVAAAHRHETEGAMRKFLAKHAAATTGTLSCFDRLLFKGHLSLGYPHGMEDFLNHHGNLFKQFKPFVLRQAVPPAGGRHAGRGGASRVRSWPGRRAAPGRRARPPGEKRSEHDGDGEAQRDGGKSLDRGAAWWRLHPGGVVQQPWRHRQQAPTAVPWRRQSQVSPFADIPADIPVDGDPMPVSRVRRCLVPACYSRCS